MIFRRRVLDMSEKRNRLAKYVGYSVERVRYVAVANLIRHTTGIQCNCSSSGSDGESLKYHAC